MVGYNLESRHPGMIQSILIEDFVKILQPTLCKHKRELCVAK